MSNVDEKTGQIFDDLFKTFGCGSVSHVHLKLFYNPTDKPKLFPSPLKSNHNIKRSTGIHTMQAFEQLSTINKPSLGDISIL
ncbi:hypothetical protein N665_0190s0045 [Sinapis alba]|nr:hypothetical protein N665_0190s0045 [Sinapis alba]